MKTYLNGGFAYQLLQLDANPTINGFIRQLEARLLGLPGTIAATHRMGGRKFRLGKKEIGHLHWDGDLDILFTKAIGDQLMQARLLEVHKLVPASGWTTFRGAAPEDTERAWQLLLFSYLQKAKKYEPERFE